VGFGVDPGLLCDGGIRDAVADLSLTVVLALTVGVALTVVVALAADWPFAGGLALVVDLRARAVDLAGASATPSSPAAVSAAEGSVPTD
jgi:hypothetical protein